MQREAGAAQGGLSHCQGQSSYPRGETPAEVSQVTLVVAAMTADAVVLLLAALDTAAGLTLALHHTALGVTEQLGGRQQL